MPAPQLILQFAIQVIVILIVCRLAGRVMAMIGQPRVIGEMIAGILLGPSLLGLISPAAQAALFPHDSLSLLSFVSQVGVVLYMFVLGTQLHTGFIRDDIRGASMISLAGIIAPFLLGAALAAFLYGDGRFFGPGASALAQPNLSRRRHVGDRVSRARAHHRGTWNKPNAARHSRADCRRDQ